jgi:predicted DNA-binding transcriptional regulator AlpA
MRQTKKEASANVAAIAERKPAVERLGFRIDEVARSLGISRRAVERARHAGQFPEPDAKIGRMPIWRVSTIENWLAGQND